ncbi:efflux RND transporter periplasmic adaptor subunit [Candidatus Anaplasma sp. TIGMIC]|uniref:efflux RND transporter periplasmic adaptor subunit n=1 Tax=Candidatus Anaplasma sp. TIGMIC TaxID=3020713 RepID=UPI00232ACD70|nr:efflux RND transporter periplasmic adaptor subunit [Candidatus Anaplasma sp. TIGMIC]MDB1134983.1 efflux RND transporter periplasmic adaptor subunit [Candidatus Anaplasma sp. TIGMIC]
MRARLLTISAKRLAESALKLKLRYKVAIALVIVCALWLNGGRFYHRGALDSTIVGTADSGDIIDIAELRVSNRKVLKILPAKVHAVRSVGVVSEVGGRVEEILLKGGSSVVQDQVILKIEEHGQLELLEQAEELLRQRKLEYDAAESLGSTGYRSQVHEQATLVALKDAEANHRNAQFNYKNTAIRAPFSGVVDEIFPQVGSVIGAGQLVARIADFETLKVVTYLPEGDVPYVRVGDLAGVTLGRNGVVLPGEVSFVGRVVSPETKSCRVEILVDYRDNGAYVADGMSAEVGLAVGEVRAYKIPSTSLSLGDDGVVGVKILDENDTVRFLGVEIVDDDNKGHLWVSGIPYGEVRLIVRGHEYALDGELMEGITHSVQSSN